MGGVPCSRILALLLHGVSVACFALLIRAIEIRQQCFSSASVAPNPTVSLPARCSSGQCSLSLCVSYYATSSLWMSY